MSDNATAFPIKISQSFDLLNIPKKDGVYRREVEDGIVHTFTISDGKVLKREAFDRDGNPLPTYRLRITASGGFNPPFINPDSPKCYFCVSGGDTWGGGGGETHNCWVDECDM